MVGGGGWEVEGRGSGMWDEIREDEDFWYEVVVDLELGGRT